MNDLRIKTYKDFVGELSVTYKRSTLPSVFIKSSKEAADFMRPFFDEIMDDHEQVKVLHLNRTNGVVNIDHSTIGNENGSIVSAKRILQKVILIKTNAIILFHNHPSGKLVPSQADLDISRKLKEACKLLEFDLLDSIILTREGYYSLADNGDF